jgi:hypothetical protein
MTSIERTAYPRFTKTRQISKKQLYDIYTPSSDELYLAEQHTNDAVNKLNFLVMLKSFQRFGYFPAIEQVPMSIIQQIAKSFGIEKALVVQYRSNRSAQSHKKLIREILGVKIYDKQAKNIILQIGYRVCLTLNDPADIINVMIEELIAKCYEFPSFNILDRVARHCRSKINNKIFEEISKSLPENLKHTYDSMISSASQNGKTVFNDIKKIPKKATINNVCDFIAHHNWLSDFGEMQLYLKNIAKSKIKAFAF